MSLSIIALSILQKYEYNISPTEQAPKSIKVLVKKSLSD
jgi:hypothetical protein